MTETQAGWASTSGRLQASLDKHIIPSAADDAVLMAISFLGERLTLAGAAGGHHQHLARRRGKTSSPEPVPAVG